MFLSEVFEQLTYGELAQLSIGGLPSGGILPADYPRLVTNINAALIELYTVFPLKTSQLSLQLYEHIALYTLHSDYALSNSSSTEPYKYIIDTETAPFKNDILLVDNVFNEVGDEYPINESKEEYSVFLPSYNQIQVPFSQDENALAIVYRASPELLITSNIDPESTWVPIPYQLMSCLIAFVLNKIHSSIGSGTTSDAGMYFNKYKEEVNIVKNLGLSITETSFNEKLDTGGWV